MKPEKDNIGIGATAELSLRVSVGVLVRLLFYDPGSGRQMLALERTATLKKTGGEQGIEVKARPFGGAVRLIDPAKLKDKVGNFHYDSHYSHREGDFRIMINPGSWEKIKEVCQEHLDDPDAGILDFSPEYELAEEFGDCLGIKIKPGQYCLDQPELIVEDTPTDSDNLYAPGLPTMRIYYMFKAEIKEARLIKRMLQNSRSCTDGDLRKMAGDDAESGGKGRANAMLALEMEELGKLYHSLPVGKSDRPVYARGHLMDAHVPAILAKINDQEDF